MTDWRIIPTETRSAAMHMALDEACMEAVRAGDVPSTIRLYRWKPSAVSIGNFQCLTDEVDTDICLHEGVAVVRRLTGGGAVYHDAEGEITYSLIAPEEEFPSDINASYQDILRPVIDGLKDLGIRAEFRPINDLVVDGKKISGNAQTRKGGVLLQHGTILFTVDPERMFSYLTPDKAKLSDKPFIKSVKAAVTSVREQKDVSREEVEAAIRKRFVERFGARPAGWTAEEQDRARLLAQEKYGDASWNAMR